MYVAQVSWLGYSRVSRVGDRAETLISPDLQAARIASYAQARGLEVEMLKPELDVSGGKVSRPILDAAIERVERGEADGIIVAQLDRLSRAGIIDTHKIIERLGPDRLISVAENFDAGTPEGRLGRNVFLALGEMQLDRYRAQFEAAKAQAVARGIWPMSKAPRGYVVGSERKLVPGPDADRVVAAFEARAQGAPWSRVAEVLGAGVSGAQKTIRNRVYLGEVAIPKLGLVNADAHEALVDPVLWEAAQLEKPKPPRGVHGPALLGGLVRCEACGYLMSPDTEQYRCFPHKVRGRCKAPATISRRLLEPYVERILLAQVGAATYSLDAAGEVTAAERELQAAEAELAAYQQATAVAGVGAEHFAAGMKQRVEAVEAARRTLAESRLAAEPLPHGGEVAELWPTLSVDERRHVLGSSLSAVRVAKGRGLGRVRVVDRHGTSLTAPEDVGEGAGEV